MDTVFILLQRITKLATDRQTPLIILRNPKRDAAKLENPHMPNEWPYDLLATIGNTSVAFDGYCLTELIDLYAELKAGLEADEAAIQASRATWDRAHEVYRAKNS